MVWPIIVAEMLSVEVRQVNESCGVGLPHKELVGEKSRLQCAGVNRHEVEDERALRERSSDPLGPESCAVTARDTAKRRQGIGGVGIQLRKDAIRTPTFL